MNNFKPGDKVVCIENKGRPDLNFGQEYTVEWARAGGDYGNGMVKVKEIDFSAFYNRFELSKKHYLNEFERLL